MIYKRIREVVYGNETPNTECDDCGKVWRAIDLAEIKDYFKRVKPGGVVPSGECPKAKGGCGALCYPSHRKMKEAKLVR